MKKWIAVVVLMVLVLGVGACTERDISNRREETQDAIGGQLKDSWKAETGEAISGNPRSIPENEMSESHSIMASMILSGRGMSTDLGTYGEVYLVEFKDPDGVERAAVYADGKIVLPENAGQ